MRQGFGPEFRSRAGTRNRTWSVAASCPRATRTAPIKNSGSDLRLAAQNARCDGQSKLDDFVLRRLQKRSRSTAQLAGQVSSLVRSLSSRFAQQRPLLVSAAVSRPS